jgi:predicted amidohydrolase
MTGRTLRVASAAWPIEWHSNWDSFAAKVTAWVQEAAGQKAQLLLLPEYALMELAALHGAAVAGDAAGQVPLVAAMAPEVQALFAALSRANGCHILAGSMVEADGADRFVNRARLYGPGGGMGAQDKQILTMWERDHWVIEPGDGTTPLFDIGVAKIGVQICYDSEFPAASRALAAAGAEILLDPSCTDSVAGYWRVRIGAMARALEGQCYAVQSSTVGDAPWSAVVDANVGAAGFFAPPDKGLPENGIVALGALNAPGWTIADLDLDLVAAVRQSGAVRGWSHWQEQPGANEKGGIAPALLQQIL